MKSCRCVFRLVFLWCCLALGVGACGSAHNPAKDDTQSVTDIRAVIEAQQAAWNRGDIERFMNGYDRADTTMFVSGDELTRGWQTVLDRYKQHYRSREEMGKLTFSDLDIQTLGPSYAVADGRWKLSRSNDSPHGRFTLLFYQTNSGWRIVHDTTTSVTP